MSEKDINIHIRAKNADAAKRQVDGFAASTKKVGSSAKEGSGGVKQLGDTGILFFKILVFIGLIDKD